MVVQSVVDRELEGGHAPFRFGAQKKELHGHARIEGVQPDRLDA
jgi:hypothetical protein